MQSVLVSVIVPIYNVEKYLERCLESIRNQKYSNIEVIMVNDGSTDSSRVIAEKFSKIDKRFVLVNKKNGGLSSSRNEGLQHICGEFVSFIDSDDFISELYIQNLLDEFDDETDIVIGDYAIFNEKNNKFYSHSNSLKNGIYISKRDKERLVGNLLCGKYAIMPVWKNMYRTSFLQKNNLKFVSERLVYAEDKLFNLEAYTLARKIKIRSEVVFYHLVNPCSLSQSYRKDRFAMNKELHFRIMYLINKYYDNKFLLWYDNLFTEQIGATMFGVCKCRIMEALHNIKTILNDKVVIETYKSKKKATGMFRYRILYVVGNLKSPLLVVALAKLMQFCNPLYRFFQMKEEIK